MKPGDLVYYTIGRRTVAGLPATGKVLSDFVIGTYLNGAAVSVATSCAEIGADGAFQEYKIGITTPATAGRVKYVIQPTTGLDLISPGLIEGEVESYDLTAVAALLLLAQGTPAVQSADDSNLGDIVDGDSFKSATLTMPAGKLSPFSITDISAGGIAVEAAIMGTPGGTSYPITATVVSGPGLTFNFSWDAQQHPALAAGVFSATWYIDVQVIKTGPPKDIITTNRYSFTQQWQRDTRTT